MKIGLLINFHVVHLRDGITRRVNNMPEEEMIPNLCVPPRPLR
jgi:hypothetical protein